MSKYVDAVEKALADFKKDTKIPYYFERFDGDEKKLPDTYAVWFLVSSSSASSADGKERLRTLKVQFSLFYRKKKTFLTIPEKLVNKLTENGFRQSNEGRIPYQQNTGHYGWRSDFIFLEKR